MPWINDHQEVGLADTGAADLELVITDHSTRAEIAVSVEDLHGLAATLTELLREPEPEPEALPPLPADDPGGMFPDDIAPLLADPVRAQSDRDPGAVLVDVASGEPVSLADAAARAPGGINTLTAALAAASAHAASLRHPAGRDLERYVAADLGEMIDRAVMVESDLRHAIARANVAHRADGAA